MNNLQCPARASGIRSGLSSGYCRSTQHAPTGGRQRPLLRRSGCSGLSGCQRGGDLALDIGQNFSISYLSHTADTVELYLEESFVFRVLTSEATVAITAANSKAPSVP